MSTPDRLAQLVATADGLYSCRPNNERMQDLCCIVRGYVSLFDAYKNGQQFPWKRVHTKLKYMRELAQTPIDRRYRLRRVCCGQRILRAA